MKVAIDSGPLKSGHAIRGIGMHTKELIQELKRAESEKIQIDDFHFSDKKDKLKNKKYDIIHYTSFNPSLISLPTIKPSAKLVLTIHDLIPLIYPKHYPLGIKGKIRFLINKIILNNIDAIVTISEASKKDICRFLDIKPEKVHVIYLAPRNIFKTINDQKLLKEIKNKYNLPSSFALYVGDVNYNKNVPTLIKACKEINLPLVICGKQSMEIEEYQSDLRNLVGPRDWIRFLFGKPHPEQAHFKDLLEEFNKNPQILRLGFVSDADLVAIYNLATVYCQPSYYEGFGLPVLEAFACGTPVVASKIQALVEIGEGAALFADPRNPNDFSEKIKKVLNNKNVLMIKKGKHIANNFTWEKTVDNTLKVYKRLINK